MATEAREGGRDDARDRVVSAVRQRFAFLDQRPGCRIEEEHESLLTTVAYVLDDLTFEVHIDWRDAYASAMVGRTMGGGRPPVYLIHFGLRVRYHLIDLLPVTAKTNALEAAVTTGLGRPRRKAKAMVATGSRTDRMIEEIAAMAAALAQSFDDVVGKARHAFAAADEHRKLSAPPLPPHACAGLIAMLEDLDSPIQYNPILREIQRRRSPTETVTLTTCPACGEALPRSLRSDLHQAMAELQPDATGVARVPAEMHSDEWWRRRGL